jgi:hypothetical protein
MISSEEKEIMNFLLNKKYYMERNKMIDALKGGKNIFNLPSIEIKDDHLKLYQ